MTPTQRLKIYKQALKAFEEKAEYTNLGLCSYFIWEIDCYLHELPELFQVRPKKMYGPWPTFWYKPGNRRPRIAALKRAIAICEGTQGARKAKAQGKGKANPQSKAKAHGIGKSQGKYMNKPNPKQSKRKK